MAVDSDPARMTIALASPSVRPAPASQATPGAAAQPESESKVWQDGDTTSFRDILAILNPLQHIPIVGTIYREITGDQIGFMPRVIGSALFGGPIGFALGLVNGLLKSETGKDAGEAVASLFGSDPAPGEAPPDALVAKAPAPEIGPATGPATGPAAGPKSAGSETIPTISAQALDRLMAQSSAQSSAPAPGPASAGGPGTLPQTGGISLKFQGDNPRFRSTSLPQPVAEGGGLATHTGADLVPTSDGAAISRDQVPAAMMRALEKYGDIMRSRTAQQTASAQIAAAQMSGQAGAGPVNVLR